MAAKYNPLDYDKLYGGIARTQKSALDAALAGQQAALNQQAGQLQGQYNTLRGQAYTNSRLSALGNNEQLAAAGLAGAPNAAPSSGYSETSRTAQSIALQNAINGLNQQQQGALTDLATQGTQARLGRDQQWAGTSADLDAQRMNAQAQQNQFAAQFNQSEEAAALQKAQAEVQLFGKIKTKATSAILGLPIGTKLR